ncbi:hypothetical protein C1H46_037454 [Malus baccata]|uniref:Uncharacterized protein n=1 Tax=Malus baccata TaxID=106549 RepID=A0A540KS21_MALBA|nr:hypothetical protein C1H46_037454 [Malus baccata]
MGEARKMKQMGGATRGRCGDVETSRFRPTTTAVAEYSCEMRCRKMWVWIGLWESGESKRD